MPREVKFLALAREFRGNRNRNPVLMLMLMPCLLLFLPPFLKFNAYGVIRKSIKEKGCNHVMKNAVWVRT